MHTKSNDNIEEIDYHNIENAIVNNNFDISRNEDICEKYHERMTIL